jgi:hypothetical protein
MDIDSQATALAPLERLKAHFPEFCMLVATARQLHGDRLDAEEDPDAEDATNLSDILAQFRSMLRILIRAPLRDILPEAKHLSGENGWEGQAESHFSSRKLFMNSAYAENYIDTINHQVERVREANQRLVETMREADALKAKVTKKYAGALQALDEIVENAGAESGSCDKALKKYIRSIKAPPPPVVEIPDTRYAYGARTTLPPPPPRPQAGGDEGGGRGEGTFSPPARGFEGVQILNNPFLTPRPFVPGTRSDSPSPAASPQRPPPPPPSRFDPILVRDVATGSEQRVTPSDAYMGFSAVFNPAGSLGAVGESAPTRLNDLLGEIERASGGHSTESGDRLDHTDQEAHNFLNFVLGTGPFGQPPNIARGSFGRNLFTPERPSERPPGTPEPGEETSEQADEQADEQANEQANEHVPLQPTVAAAEAGDAASELSVPDSSTGSESDSSESGAEDQMEEEE